jgi:GNAT superfamily N-acetyltransferase
VVSVLVESFFDYPVMRGVVGDLEPYASHLRSLVAYFVAARFLRGETVLGVGPVGALAGAALLSRPGGLAAPPELLRRREALWSELGNGARERYERFGVAASAFDVAVPHLHLNLIGVRTEARGTGMGRRLLDAVHRIALEDPDAHGVSLTTEVESNVDLYGHVGYRVIGEATLHGALTTWAMFRPNAPSARP